MAEWAKEQFESAVLADLERQAAVLYRRLEKSALSPDFTMHFRTARRRKGEQCSMSRERDPNQKNEKPSSVHSMQQTMSLSEALASMIYVYPLE